MRFSDLHQAIKLAGLVALWAGLAVPAAADPLTVQLGSRPFYLVQEMDPGPLKEELQECAAKRVHYHPNLFSIGHRGAPLQFPEHTKESYVAAARMGAGILECDVTFTGDGELVCRHAQCDLHTTTDIVARPDLRAKCAVPPEIGPKFTAHMRASALGPACVKTPARQDSLESVFCMAHKTKFDCRIEH